jgi:hypothetical protein
VAITTTPSPIQYLKTIVPTTTPGEVYSQTLCPEHCSCVGKEMICNRDLVAETFDVRPTPLQFGKPAVTTTPDEVYPQTLCPKHCSCVGKDMICYGPNLPETFDVTPTSLQYGKPEVTTKPYDITCPETCTCMVESSARAQGRFSCGVPVWSGGCEGLGCDWC